MKHIFRQAVRAVSDNIGVVATHLACFAAVSVALNPLIGVATLAGAAAGEGVARALMNLRPRIG